MGYYINTPNSMAEQCQEDVSTEKQNKTTRQKIECILNSVSLKIEAGK